MTVTNSSDEKAALAGAKAVPQHELDAQAMREKIARLRELRLAQEAATGKTASSPPVKRAATSKKPPRKGEQKSVPLSDWLATQQKEGRRN
jgi:hypothetical protein